ncbi:MAG: gamma-glutamyl-gamma-aminobutyrate hydrolase family protein, partial [Anaerotardibacter sp.]
MKPLIGITPLYDTEKESLWMLPAYYQGIIKSGGIPVIFSFDNTEESLLKLADTCDGFLFTGGQDVSPFLYGEWPLESCGEVSAQRDSLEEKLLEIALKKEKPVLGICRGLQLLNAALGGSLYQDIESQLGDKITHRQSKPYHQPVHQVNLVSKSPLQKLLCVRQLEVNSLHH